MTYYFRYHVNKALNMIQRMFFCIQTFSPITLGLVRKRALRNLVRTMNYLKLPCRTLIKDMLTNLSFSTARESSMKNIMK